MPQGLIVKALSGYYYVEASGDVIQCRARGIFKKKGISPLVGDYVEFTVTENGEGMVDKIMPRSSELIRPPISNVEQAILVFSVQEPELNLQLLDKFLVHIEHAGLDVVICFTKEDLLDEPSDEGDGDLPASSSHGKEITKIEDAEVLYKQIGYTVIRTSSVTGMGKDELMTHLNGKISVFAGQSGVGKSSMLNALLPGLSLETNQISMRLGRGKHTTRHVELITLPEGGFVADTPGFSQLDFLELGVEALGDCFREFHDYAAECKFRGCTHIHEPGCRVLAAKASGDIAPSRYDHYVLFFTEMKEKKRRY
ncbi:ribosome small subunit-dependent GTPase A [Paenibacillus selenitireducens]|uniref:Small ribosomal subunit biogenesis GTPase RsgA n=1 Tax=Paenibacillus selenitireducens TaxID=1324314 RepID=A0A1T2XFA7_9BACL|nr:ribosome small subunit-dependent GTPase A [Paenibacillus selenitireducens]OPA78587.1 ribosome small subunit-dependent GTPase A [Paenibacillus selenitireducens]